MKKEEEVNAKKKAFLDALAAEETLKEQKQVADAKAKMLQEEAQTKKEADAARLAEEAEAKAEKEKKLADIQE